MEKFSEKQLNDAYIKNNPEQVGSEYIFNGKHVKIREYKGWECIEEQDYIACIPHLIDRGEIVLRKEWIPTFLLKEPNKEFHITVVAGGIEKDESPEDAMFRELEEEAGIRINTHYSGFKKIGEFYNSKGSCTKCHLFYIPLERNDFQYVQPISDGSEAEEKSFSVIVDLQYIDSIKTSDVISQLCISELKHILNNPYQK